MGSDWSSPPVEPEKYVVVPPILDLDREHKNRMINSSYDWMCKKRDMHYLLDRFFPQGAAATICLSPPADRGWAITTKLWDKSDGAKKLAEGLYSGGLNVRWQPDERNPLSFIAMNTNFMVRL